jgi:hypothetical protein
MSACSASHRLCCMAATRSGNVSLALQIHEPGGRTRVGVELDILEPHPLELLQTHLAPGIPALFVREASNRRIRNKTDLTTWSCLPWPQKIGYVFAWSVCICVRSKRDSTGLCCALIPQASIHTRMIWSRMNCVTNHVDLVAQREPPRQRDHTSDLPLHGQAREQPDHGTYEAESIVSIRPKRTSLEHAP